MGFRGQISHWIRRFSGVNDRCSIIHVPKCGGTSIEHAVAPFYNCDGEQNVDLDAVLATQSLLSQQGDAHPFDFRSTTQAVFVYKPNLGARLLCGHFPVDRPLIEKFEKNYHFVTLLREPVQRWISHYVYSRMRLSERGARSDVHSLEEELLSYLSTDEAADQARIYLYYFGGARSWTDPSESARREAIRSLERFTLLGFLDEFDVFVRRLSDLLGVELACHVERKTAELRDPLGYSYQDYHALFTDRMRLRIAELCAVDTFIYENARWLDEERRPSSLLRPS